MIDFLYIIRNRCGIVWFTSDPVVAQQASENGCIVTCKGISSSKVFKGSNKKNIMPENLGG